MKGPGSTLDRQRSESESYPRGNGQCQGCGRVNMRRSPPCPCLLLAQPSLHRNRPPAVPRPPKSAGAWRSCNASFPCGRRRSRIVPPRGGAGFLARCDARSARSGGEGYADTGPMTWAGTPHCFAFTKRSWPWSLPGDRAALVGATPRTASCPDAVTSRGACPDPSSLPAASGPPHSSAPPWGSPPADAIWRDIRRGRACSASAGGA